MNIKNSVIASKNMDIKCDDEEKNRRRRDWSVDDFDAVETSTR